MSDTTETESLDGVGGGVLASLPRTRPQRASKRRETARASTAAAKRTKAPGKPVKVSVKPETATKTKPQRAKRTPAATKGKRGEPPVPPQGFEPENEAESTAAITPPTGTELLSSLADVAGEVLGASMSSGGRLLRDALSRL